MHFKLWDEIIKRKKCFSGIRNRMFWGLPDSDPYVDGSGSGPGPGSFHRQAKKFRKNL
jgi:hypothetical protein